MAKQDYFDRMATGISKEERQNILNQMHDPDPIKKDSIELADDKFEDNSEPLEIIIKKEPVFVRFIIWLKSVLSNTTQTAIYNEYKLSEISHSLHRNFPGLVNTKQSIFLQPFYERLMEMKECADFFRPYVSALDDNDGDFYVYLSSFVIPNVNDDLRNNVDPYSNPVNPTIPPDTRSNFLRKMEEIFDTIPANEKNYMYQAAKATDWMKRFVKLPFSRTIVQFSAADGKNKTCAFGQIDNEIDTLAQVFCNAISIPDEFLEAIYMYTTRNSKFSNDDVGKNMGQFLGKARLNVSMIQMFITSVPLRSIGCLIHSNCQWRTEAVSGGEDWFVKYKSTWKRIFDQKWLAWESDCKKEALLSTLKIKFGLDAFPIFPERPWENIHGGIKFTYDSSLGFLNWFMRERFSICELDLKSLLVQGSFNKKDNYSTLSETFGEMIQLSISFQELERKLSMHGETGSLLYKILDDKSKSLQGQNKIDQIMREIESSVTSLIHKFVDNTRIMDQILAGVLGLTKDTRFDTVSNLNKLRDKNNEPLVTKIEEAKTVMENALGFVMDLEQLDKQKR